MSRNIQNTKAVVLALAIIVGFSMQVSESHAAATAETPSLLTDQVSHPPCHGV